MPKKPRKSRATVTQRHTGRWYVGMDDTAMKTLVSLVRIYGDEWLELSHSTNTPEEEIQAAKQLYKAIDAAW